MADPLREALAALADQWSRFGRGDPLDPWTAHAADLRAHLVAHPEPPEPPAPEGAVRVRIAVAVDAEGEWAASGEWSRDDDEAARSAIALVGEPDRLSWVEAWVPRPEAEQVVEGRVAPEGE